MGGRQLSSSLGAAQEFGGERTKRVKSTEMEGIWSDLSVIVQFPRSNFAQISPDRSAQSVPHNA